MNQINKELTMLRSANFLSSLGGEEAIHPFSAPKLMRNSPKIVSQRRGADLEKLHVTGYGNTYSIDNLMADFLSVATDATGQYVAATTKYPTAYVYLSQNNGSTFQQVTSPTAGGNEFPVAIATNAPNYVLVGGYNCVAASSNYGATFQCVSPNGMYTWPSVTVSGNGSLAYAVYQGAGNGNGQIYVSTNYLASFTLVSSIPNDYYSEVALSTDGAYLFVGTADSVLTYNTQGNTVLFTNRGYNYISSISCSSTGQYVAIVYSGGFVRFSSNYGKSWTTSSPIANVYGSVVDVAFSSSGQLVALVTDGTAVFTSSNYGGSFKMTLSSAQVYTAVASSSSGNNLYAVAEQSHLFQSVDAGVTWSPLFYPWYGAAMSQSGQYRIVSTEEYTDNAVYLSSDGGISWQDITSSTPTYLAGSWLVAAMNADGQYMAITTETNDVIVSSDFGKTWATKSVGSDYNIATTAIAISASGQYMTAVTNTGFIYTSTNYGSSFSPAASSTAQNYWSVAMSSSGQLQIATVVYYSFFNTSTDGGYVYMSTDYGSNWNQVPNLPFAEFWSAATSDAAGVNLAVAQGYGGSIYYSTDSGITWTNANFLLGINFVSMCQSSSGQLLYVADGGGPGSSFNEGSIYFSTDYGASWNVTTSPIREWGQVSCDSTGQYVTATVNEGQVYTSGDFGVTWIPQNLTVIPTGYVSDDHSNTDDGITSNALSDGAVAGIVIGSLSVAVIIGLVVAVFVFGFSLPCFSKIGAGKKPTTLLDNQF